MTDNAAPPLLDHVLVELAQAVAPLRRLSGLEDIVGLLRQLGFALDQLDGFAADQAGPLLACLEQLASAAGTLVDLVETVADQGVAAAATADLKRVGQAANDFLQSVRGLPAAARATLAALPQALADIAPTLEQLPRRLLDHLVVGYLRRRAPALYSGLLLAGLIENRACAPDRARLQPAFVLRRAHWERLPLLFTEPPTLLQVTYGWGGAELDSDLLLGRALLALRAFGLSAGLYDQNETIAARLGRLLAPPAAEPEPPAEALDEGALSYVWMEVEAAETDVAVGVAPEPEAPFQPTEEPEELSNAYPPNAAGRELRIPLFRWQADGTTAEAGLNLSPLPATAAGDPAGLALLPYGLAGSELRLQQGAWEIALGLMTGGKLDAGVLLRPNALEIRTGLLGAPAAELEAGLRVSARRVAPVEGELTLLGSPAGTRLAVAGVELTGLAQTSTRAGWDIGLRLGLEQFKLAIAAGDGDGFLQSVLPQEPLVIGFALAAGYSRRLGLHLGDGPTLDHSLAINRSFGPLFVDHIDLRPSGDVTLARLEALATGGLKLGPLDVVVENIGLQCTLDLRRPGLLGVADLSVGFKPPAGLGVAIDAGQVKGGGYLFFDAERQQYAGALHLKLGGVVNVVAVGLLTTRLPDGSSGFSLFILITAAGFAPIPLGLGFTLNGIGGLLGLNRTALTERLRAGLKQGALDNILFPADPLRNAPALVSALNAVFPPARDRFLFGPIVIIGWGAPTILSLKLAIILELPDPIRLLLLGRLAATLPDEKQPLLRVQMDAIGELDFRRGTVALDATLVDSRLLDFVLTGDMALRAGWGESPHFVLAAGGFNPRFAAPAGFPSLERLAIIFADRENLKLRLDAYLALTSNTAQLGARLDLYAKAGSFSVDGSLGFDTLFQFAPFSFIADIGAAIALRHKGRLLLGVTLAATLSGPTPWRLRGKATAEIAFLSFSIEIDERFGRAEPPPPLHISDVGALLRAALAEAGAWSGELPAGVAPLAALRRPAAEERLVHPLARLTLRQRIVPLEYPIERFGAARPGDERRFQLDLVSAGGELRIEPVYDDFAPGQFRDLSDDQQLRLPAFEQHIAGYTVGVAGWTYQPAQALAARLRYEGAPIAGGPSRVFLPWLRQGLPALLPAPDTLGAAQPARLTAAFEVWVNDPQRRDPVKNRISLSARCYGPGDVLGIDLDSIARIEPRRWASDFEPNYFPFVEFARPDFPWLFTPAGANADGRLRPWLCLVVVRRQAAVTLGQPPNRPLAVLECPRSELPDLRECWSWAHAQLLRGGPDDDDLDDLLDRPERTAARLLCPRRLEPETRYLACLTPTFEPGRKAGLGEALGPADEQSLHYAWGPVEPNSDPMIRLPVYYHWEFRTGLAGDFEALARRLEGRPPPPEVGFQPLDLSAPGWGMPRLPVATPGAVIALGGVLRPAGAAPGGWPDAARLSLQQALRALLAGGGTVDPVVTPPLYGQSYAQTDALPADGQAPHWLRELNLDPRYRIAAGLGAMVVCYRQEELAADAWRQFAAAGREQQAQRRAQFSAAVTESLRAKVLPILGTGAATGMAARGLGAAAEPPPEPPRFTPTFPQPTIEWLRDYFSDRLLPGLDHVPPNTVALLETDPAFIEAYLVGLNHALGRELLWREFPVDPRGAFCRHFWTPPPGGASAPAIPPIADWSPDSHLGEHLTGGGANQLVLLLRGDLLQRFPNAQISAVRAIWTGSGYSRRRQPGAEERQPVFQGGNNADVTFIGFPLTGAEARGAATDPGWFFVIRERAAAARFGLDAAGGGGRPVTAITSWDQVSWDDLVEHPADLPQLAYASLAGGRLAGQQRPLYAPPTPPDTPPPPQPVWGRTSAHAALITQQAPFSVAIHASAWLPAGA